MKALKTFFLLIAGVAIICGGTYTCSKKKLDIEAVRAHYANDSLKLAAAEFLWKNMGNKFAYTGAILNVYDTLFSIYNECLTKKGYANTDPQPAQQYIDYLIKKYGMIETSSLEKSYDRQQLSADELIEEIDVAFEAWQSAPSFISKDFDLFCHYVLPYRVGNEKWEPLRRKRFESLRIMRDSLIINNGRLIKELYHELVKVRKYQNSRLLWSYPISMSQNQMERARRGSCRHFCEYYVHILRACGIPATIDYVSVWGNRAGGHCWVTVPTDTGRVSFDALERRQLKFAYKPAKVYRQTFEIQSVNKEAKPYVPSYLLDAEHLDVSHAYGKTYNIKVKGLKEKMELYKESPYGVICVFDNKQWIPVDYGIASNGLFHFKNIMGDICYMAGYYVDGTFIPATDPFILTKDAKIQHLQVDTNQHISMKLTRKYPKFTRIRSFQKGLEGARIEVSDTPDFANTETLLTLDGLDRNKDIFDTIAIASRPYRYVRIKLNENSEGNLAEVTFYGKKETGPEVMLTGRSFGLPFKEKEDSEHVWREALDGDYNTYFKKKRLETGVVGLDLGENNCHKVTRICFVPQSDTNFIIPGNTYQLCYWNGTTWKQVGKQKATSFNLFFPEVPANGLYILHNLTNGKEERIFTYEEEKQIWW